MQTSFTPMFSLKYCPIILPRNRSDFEKMDSRNVGLGVVNFYFDTVEQF